MGLRPLDEVGHDQEVAREPHPLDNPELVIKTLEIGLAGIGELDLGQTVFQPGNRAGA